MRVNDGIQTVAGHRRTSKGVSGRLEERHFLPHLAIWNLDSLTIWNLPISQSGIWNLAIQSFNLECSDVCMMGGDNAHRRHGPRIATHRKHCTPHRSNAARTPAHAVLAWLSPSWGSFRCAFSQVSNKTLTLLCIIRRRNPVAVNFWSPNLRPHFQNTSHDKGAKKAMAPEPRKQYNFPGPVSKTPSSFPGWVELQDRYAKKRRASRARGNERSHARMTQPCREAAEEF